MILLLLIALAISVAGYLLAFKLRFGLRLGIALLLLALFGVVPLITVVIIGDKPPPDSRAVSQEELQHITEKDVRDEKAASEP